MSTIPHVTTPTNTTHVSLRGSTTTLRILHLALTASIIIYAGVLHIFLAQAAQAPAASLDDMMPLVLVLAALSVGTALIAIPIARKKLVPPRKPAAHKDDSVPSPLPAAAGAAIGKFFTASILTWALCESIAIYGFVLAFLIREAWIFYCFGAPSVALMIFYAPRFDDLEATARAALPSDE